MIEDEEIDEKTYLAKEDAIVASGLWLSNELDRADKNVFPELGAGAFGILTVIAAFNSEWTSALVCAAITSVCILLRS